MKNTLLVTGASGQLGRAAVTALLNVHRVPAQSIIATTRYPEKLADFQSAGVQVRAGDFDKPDELHRAFTGVSRALIISTDRVDTPGLRVKEHAAAVDAAVKAGIQHVVYTSMMNPEPGSPIPFAGDHYATERALEASPLTWTILRNCWYTDSLLMTLPSALASGVIPSAAGDKGASYVTREDCALAAAAALVSGRTDKVKLDVTGPQAVSHSELAKIAGELARKSIKVVPQTADELRSGLLAAGLPAPIAELLVAIDVNTSLGRVSQVTDAVATLTGKQPESVRDFLSKQAALLGGA